MIPARAKNLIAGNLLASIFIVDYSVNDNSKIIKNHLIIIKAYNSVSGYSKSEIIWLFRNQY
jgi:hypothetical protein